VTWNPSCYSKRKITQSGIYSVGCYVTTISKLITWYQKDPHCVKTPKSRIVSKGISAGKSQNFLPSPSSRESVANKMHETLQCDSALMGDRCGDILFHTSDIQLIHHQKSQHESKLHAKIGEDQIFYCNQRGIAYRRRSTLIVKRYAKEVVKSTQGVL